MSPIVLLLALLAAANPPPLSPAGDRGVFVFGRLVLDFREQAEILGRRQPLRNCSTDSLYCADGDLFNIVLPRACEELRIGARWRVGELETVVIGRRSNAQGPAASQPSAEPTIWYLQSNEHPELVYEYEPRRGVALLYYDVRGGLDFARMARNDDLDQFRRAIVDMPDREHLAMRLLTLDPFAPCNRGRG